MRLHEDRKLFADAIKATTTSTGIPEEFIEMDYWICQILQNLSRHEKANLVVWKGGTTLSKAYHLISRFSSDVDIAVLSDSLSQNQLKKVVNHVGRDIVADFGEVADSEDTIRNSRFRRTYHRYKSVINTKANEHPFLKNQIIVEINTYGNPYPYVKKSAISYICENLLQRGEEKTIEELDMAPITLNVLDFRMTLCEKIVSLLRFSFEEDFVNGLAGKIRHFYDLYFLLQEKECIEYLKGDFSKDLKQLIDHDKREFSRPPKWRNSDLSSSPLVSDFGSVWKELVPTYKSVLSALAFRKIPDEELIADSFRVLLSVLRGVG